MSDTTTVFQSGNSQAVRLPKEFRFNTKTVEIFRRGDEVVLREKRRTMADVIREVLDPLPPMTDEDAAALDEAVKAAKDLPPAEERNWSLLTDGIVADEPSPLTSVDKPARKTQLAHKTAPRAARR